MKKVVARLTLMALVLSLVTVGGASAEWIAFDRSADREVTAQAKGSADRFTIEVTIPGIEITNEEGYVAVRLPGQSRIMGEGSPELPLFTTSIVLPNRGLARVTVADVEEQVIDLKAKVLPSRGHFTREKSPKDIPLVEGDVYKKGAWFPGDAFKAEVDNPFILRDYRGAALRMTPVLYNPAEKKLRVAKKVTLSVEIGKGASVNDKIATKRPVCSDFRNIYERLFVNFKLSQTKALPNEETGRAIILCPDKWLANLAPLQAWRAQKGLESKLIPLSAVPAVNEDPGQTPGDEPGDEREGEAKVPTAAAIKAFIQGEYDAGNLAFILLVGDAADLPTLKGLKERADSDACYTKLEGNDNHADAFICRFSCTNAAELDTQVARTIAYEKTPLTGDAALTYRRATGIASAEGNPSDKQRSEELRQAELAWRYVHVDQIYDYESSNKINVTTSVNEGRGLINYIGHGSKTQWVTSRFSVQDVQALNNGDGKWPLIWSVACVNGDFVNGSDCFCEAWAKAGTPEAPKGAIGIVGASTNMAWVPPCDWQSAIIKTYMIPEVVFTGGALHCFGVEKAMEQWGDQDSSQGNMLLEQCIYFGDNTVQMRNDVPRDVAVGLAREGAAVKLAVTLPGDEPKPMAHARVVVRTALQGGSVVAVTGAEGTVEFPMAAIEALRCDGDCGGDKILVTVTGPNLVPVLDKEVALPCEEPPAQEPPADQPPAQEPPADQPR